MSRDRKRFTVLLEPAEEGSTEWYVATSPDLPGLVAQGRGMDETVAHLRNAISAFFDGTPPPYTLDVRAVVQV